MRNLLYFREPELTFGFGQACADPRDGLTLFGPLELGTYGIRVGVIGTSIGISLFRSWLARACCMMKTRVFHGLLS
jgi:hypothetical protein